MEANSKNGWPVLPLLRQNSQIDPNSPRLLPLILQCGWQLKGASRNHSSYRTGAISCPIASGQSVWHRVWALRSCAFSKAVSYTWFSQINLERWRIFKGTWPQEERGSSSTPRNTSRGLSWWEILQHKLFLMSKFFHVASRKRNGTAEIRSHNAFPLCPGEARQWQATVTARSARQLRPAWELEESAGM